MVYRVYVEKKSEFANEARTLLSDLKSFMQLKNLSNVRILNRYDVENLDAELFDYAKKTVFSEPQTDILSDELPQTEAAVFAVEYLPGQFDQRADSAAQCIQIISKGERPTVRTAKVYLLFGSLSAEDINSVKKYVINPVEAREASLESRLRLRWITISLPRLKLLTDFAITAKPSLRILSADTALQWMRMTSHSVSSILSPKSVTRQLPKFA